MRNKKSRIIVLDTETTGLNPRIGNRIIEIGCVELLNRRLTGNNFHRYINPERASEEGALAIHGITSSFLKDKPKFSEIFNDLNEYIRDAEIVIHNAPFDLSFLNAEYKLLGEKPFLESISGVIDTLEKAKEMYPGKRNSLDALCGRHGISNKHRTLHGALLDSELLAEVYLAMTRGQNSLDIDLGINNDTNVHNLEVELFPLGEITLRGANEDEQAAHELMLDKLDKDRNLPCLWRN
jgi:DNA polymerase-3 subunit epsilon